MNEFQIKLRGLMHEYVKFVYRITKQFPKDELYGVVSQVRRAVLSITLNYIEGYARFKTGNKIQFYETSYGSLKETGYLIYFSYTEKYLSETDYKRAQKLSDEIGKMLWSEITAKKSEK